MWGNFLRGMLKRVRPKPAPKGAVTLPGLLGAARIFRDEAGIPHIYASEEEAAYAALGYAVAEDRVFQLDLMRRTFGGELAAILGPREVPWQDLSVLLK